MRRVRHGLQALFVLGITLLGLPAVQAEDGDTKPTRAQVRALLLDEDPHGKRGATFRRWGDSAVPHIRALLGDPAILEQSIYVVSAVADCDTDAAATLYVEMLQSPGWGHVALPYTSTLMTTFARRVSAVPAFKPAITHYLDGAFRDWAIEIVGDEGWVDQAERLRGFLRHESLDTRRKAAKALKQLTGETIQIEEPVKALPREHLRPGALGTPIALPRRGPRRADIVDFVRWFDGAPRFLYGWSEDDRIFGHARELRVTRGEPATFEGYTLPPEVEGLAIVHAKAGARLMANADAPKRGSIARKLICLDAKAKPLWTWHPPENSIKDLTPLRDAQGAFGICVGAGGDDGIVALDLEGKPLWSVPRTYVTYAVSTHPRLPGMLLHAGGDYELFDYTRSKVELRLTSGKHDARIYVHHALLVPDTDGTASIVVAGKRQGPDTPVLLCRRVDGKELWRETLPTEVDEMVLLEAEGAPTYLVATTEGGRVLVFGLDGTLLADERLPHNEPAGERVATYALAAGPMGNGKHALAVRLLSGSFLIPIDRKALAAPSKLAAKGKAKGK